MVTEDLILYIDSQLKKTTGENIIRLRLLNAGWHPEDIEEGFTKAKTPEIKAPVLSTYEEPKVEKPVMSYVPAKPEVKKEEPTVALETFLPELQPKKAVFTESFKEAHVEEK